MQTTSMKKKKRKKCVLKQKSGRVEELKDSDPYTFNF